MMKKIIALLLALAMLLSLAACGGSAEEDPNAGKYIGVSAAVGGFAMAMSDVYPGETWIELKSGGKGDIMLDGDNFPMKWALEGEVFTLTIDGVDSVGTLNNNAIVIDLMDMGCVMTFRKEGTESVENEAPAATEPKTEPAVQPTEPPVQSPEVKPPVVQEEEHEGMPVWAVILIVVVAVAVVVGSTVLVTLIIVKNKGGKFSRD